MMVLALILGGMIDPIVLVPAVITGAAVRRWWWIMVWAIAAATLLSVLAQAIQMSSSAVFGHVLVGFVIDATLVWWGARAWSNRKRQSPRRPIA